MFFNSLNRFLIFYWTTKVILFEIFDNGNKYFENWIESPRPCSLYTTIDSFLILAPSHSFISGKKIDNFYEVIAAIKNQIEEEQAINYF